MPENIKDYFVKPDNPILRQIAVEIPKTEISSPEIQHIIETMLDIAYGKQRDVTKPYLVGLAAP